MNKLLLRTEWLFVFAVGALIAVDLLVHRVAGSPPRLDLPHLVVGALVLLIALVLMGRSTEARRRTDASLREAHERLELTQAAAGAGSWDWDIRSGRLEWSSKMFDLFGLDEGTTIASLDAWRSALHPEDREAAEARIDLALKTHAELASEFRIIRPDGQICWISALGRGAYDAQGRPLRMSGICLDITDRKRAEARAEHLASFPQVNPHPVLEIDASGTVVFSNPATTGVLERLGLKEDARAFLPDDLPVILKGLEQERESAFQREIQVGSAVFSETVQVIPAFGVARIYAFDITERMQAEEALRASEAKYRLLFQNMAEGFALYELLHDQQGEPADWRVLEVNDAYARHTGIPRDRIAGHRISELFPAAIPEYLPRFAQVVATQTPAHFETYAKAVGRHQHVVTYPAGGQRFAGIIEDITERKHAEEELRRQAAILAQIHDAVVVVDNDFRISYWNAGAERIYGYRAEEVLGQTADVILKPTFAGIGWEEVVRRFTQDGEVHAESIRVTKDGRNVWIESHVIMLRNDLGEPSESIAVDRDITARKEAEEVLRRGQAELTLAAQERATQAERQRLARELHDSVSQALYGVSLGVNTALAQLDVDRTKVREALKYSLSLIHSGLTEMRALIFELRPESLEVEGLVAALTRHTAAVGARHGIEVALGLCDEPDLPLAAKEALYRIAQEALQNAIRHARPGRLEVRLICQGDGYCLEVCDDGVGFDPLLAYPGHLGLRSMRERALSVGGTLKIVSAPDCGTQIRACVPIPTAPV